MQKSIEIELEFSEEYLDKDFLKYFTYYEEVPTGLVDLFESLYIGLVISFDIDFAYETDEIYGHTQELVEFSRYNIDTICLMVSKNKTFLPVVYLNQDAINVDAVMEFAIERISTEFENVTSDDFIPEWDD